VQNRILVNFSIFQVTIAVRPTTERLLVKYRKKIEQVANLFSAFTND